MIDVAPCDFLCKLMRNLSGHPDTAPGQSFEGGSPADPLPSATEGAEKPQPSSVVSQRGVVMVQTPAERRAIRRQRAALERETTKGVADGETLMRRVLGDRGQPAAR